MSDYYVLKCLTPLRSQYYGLSLLDSRPNVAWTQGVLLHNDAAWDNERPPSQPIALSTSVDETPDYPQVYPELTWTPIPLMTRRLVDALRNGGVDNLQAFETTLELPPGETAPQDLYLAVNIVGLVAAADLGRSAVSPGTPERLISTDFDSLAIDAGRAHGLLMFRLAENTSAVVVHRSVKDAVERAGIGTLTWLLPEEWAG